MINLEEQEDDMEEIQRVCMYDVHKNISSIDRHETRAPPHHVHAYIHRRLVCCRCANASS